MTEDEELAEDPDYTPRILILGAGPIGLEAALYARYLGYQVAVLEKDTVAHNVLRWGHIKMFSPFAMNRSSLGLAATQAQYEDLTWPADDALLTGREFAEAYLLRLAKTDLLSGCVHEHVEVVSVGRDGILKADRKDLDRAEFQFRVLVRTPEGEDILDADFVIDTTGVFNQPNSIGHGGLPATGEMELQTELESHLPDILRAARDDFEGKRVLVIGNGYSAATSVAALAELHQQNASTQTTWLTRRESLPTGPMPVLKDDPLPARTQLVKLANAAATSADSGIQHSDQTSVLAVTREADGPFRVTFGGKMEGEYEFDKIIANAGYRPDTTLFRELQIELCEATEATKPVSQWFQALGDVDALEQSSPGSQVLCNAEPNFFVLGSKSFGRNSNFLLALGLQQVRDVFTLIADRDDLDLYATMDKLI